MDGFGLMKVLRERPDTSELHDDNQFRILKISRINPRHFPDGKGWRGSPC